jgi:hypothetical protein
LAHAHGDALRLHDDLAEDASPVEREAWYRVHTSQPDPLVRALAREEDESLRLLLSKALPLP